MVVHAFNPNTRETEADGSLSSRPVWSTRASSRTDSIATEKFCLKKQNKQKKFNTFEIQFWCLLTTVWGFSGHIWPAVARLYSVDAEPSHHHRKCPSSVCAWLKVKFKRKELKPKIQGLVGKNGNASVKSPMIPGFYPLPSDKLLKVRKSTGFCCLSWTSFHLLENDAYIW